MVECNESERRGSHRMAQVTFVECMGTLAVVPGYGDTVTVKLLGK